MNHRVTTDRSRHRLFPVVALLCTAMAFLTGCPQDDGGSEEDGADSGEQFDGYTGRFFEDQNNAWASHRGLTSTRFGELFEEYEDRGSMLIDVQARPTDEGVRYGMIWRNNTDDRDWRENRNMTASQMQDRMDERRDQGLRAMDVEGYWRNSEVQHAAIWVENEENIDWEARWNMSSSEFADFHDNMDENDFRPIDINPYDTGSGLQMAGVWYENAEDIDWEMQVGMTRDEYQDQTEDYAAADYIMIDYEAYEDNLGPKYAAIWVKPNTYGSYQIRTNRDETAFANLWREYRDDGYRLVDYTATEMESGTRYGGIWIENAERINYAHKSDLDQVIESHQSEFNVTGISVAVIEDGDFIYRQGFGDADSEQGRIAHSRTIYKAASISKAIGGTLAAKLEAEGELADGTSIDLDLSLPTDHYLGSVTDPITWEDYGSLPSHHNHTVEQLLSHIACISHYEDDDNPEDPYINNRTAHYPTQSQALTEAIDEDAHEIDIWDGELLPDCNIGADRNYSTPAFTFVGAVLEQATGRVLSRLLHEELFEPYGLDDTRVQFADPTLPPEYDRAVPYGADGDSREYSDNSWKTIGGGVESSAYDLARFGWMVLDGDIVDNETRDERLWSPTPEHCADFFFDECRYGLGWRGINGYLEHGGSWTGAFSLLRVYPDDDMVVAVMSNRRRGEPDGPNQDLDELIDDMHGIITAD